jgi:rfaE bifunctional protein nucleotidyltransferase chain/domain
VAPGRPQLGRATAQRGAARRGDNVWAMTSATNTPVPSDASAASAPAEPTFFAKFCRREELSERIAALPKPVVFTNGVFDLLHRGHVCYLAQARALGASLVLGLNSDASARLLGKGPDRPLNAEADRACVLAALESVSLVTLFDEATPCSLIELVRPQFYVKGGDYDIEALEETRLVRSWGGQARALAFVDGFSTTALVRRIRA